jgi:hypothetical protein
MHRSGRRKSVASLIFILDAILCRLVQPIKPLSLFRQAQSLQLKELANIGLATQLLATAFLSLVAS